MWMFDSDVLLHLKRAVRGLLGYYIVRSARIAAWFEVDTLSMVMPAKLSGYSSTSCPAITAMIELALQYQHDRCGLDPSTATARSEEDPDKRVHHRG